MAASPTEHPQQSLTDRFSGLREYVDVIRRRRALFLLVLVLLPAVAVLRSATQEPTYQATADVLLTRQNLATSLNDIYDPSTQGGIDFDRQAETQADLATSPTVIDQTLRRAGLPLTRRSSFRANSAVQAKANADILSFRFRSRDPNEARRLVSLYADVYTEYRRSVDTAALRRARDEVVRRIDQLEDDDGGGNAGLLRALRSNEQQLSTLEALQTSNAFVVRRPQDASKVSPRPVRAAALGLFLGLVLGLLIAFGREALDTRLRDAEDVSGQLDLPLLTRVPTPPKRLRMANELVMRSEPDSQYAEAFRVLRTNLEFANLDADARTIMVTSAVQSEGKSTTLANLAVAFARAGRRVVLVDLDLRRPLVAKFFDLVGAPGVTDVALGEVPLVEALAEIPLQDDATLATGERNGRKTASAISLGDQRARAHLRVLPAGPLPPDPGEFVGSRRLEQILDELRDDADFVLVDAPPLLSVGDALTLSARIDAVLVVSRLSIVRRPMLRDVRRLLASTPARLLGLVATGAEVDDAHRYSYGYEYGYSQSSTESGKALSTSGSN